MTRRFAEGFCMSAPGRLIAVGDVHGCLHALECLLGSMAPRPEDCLVFLGDLIDNGRDSAAVLDLMLELRRHCQVVMIRGNHEELLLAVHEGEAALRYWEELGGINTLNSYRFGAGIDEIPVEHWVLLFDQLQYFETEQFIFTHASYVPDLPLVDHVEHELRWALFEPENLRPHHSGKTVIVGHTEQRNGEILDLGFAICIDTACWKHGWLTALEVHTRQVWQASRWGTLRSDGEPVLRERLVSAVDRGLVVSADTRTTSGDRVP
jgi:serine/threonine protein phosphatase 1